MESRSLMTSECSLNFQGPGVQCSLLPEQLHFENKCFETRDLSGKTDRSRVNSNTKRVGESRHVDGGMFTTVVILIDVFFVCEFKGSSRAPGGWNNTGHCVNIHAFCIR